MPVVTVPDSPSGEPTATTSWPTRSCDESPSVAGVRPETPWARTTARSALGSVPTTCTGARLPFWNTALRPWGAPVAPPLSGACPSGDCCWAACPASRTWALVRIRPSAEMTTPEPSPDGPSSWTTLGRTVSATCSTEPAGAGDDGAVPEPDGADESTELVPSFDDAAS